MKNTFSVIVALFMLLMLPVVSFSAAPRPYVSGQLGVAFLTDSDLSFYESSALTGTLEFDPGLAISVAGGANFGMFRVEGEIGYQQNDVDKMSACLGGSCGAANASGEASALSILGNVYFDFVNSSPVTPYITAGLGIAKVEIDDLAAAGAYGGSEDDTVFAYQFGVGLAFAINKNMAIDLKYRYFATDDLDLDGVEAEFASHNVYCGFRYTF